ncbi:efflux RND transporter periplasmic adaptor subunit [Tenacibaculum finnmarkense]|uniref:Efflux RND transporter periplasmic adaptor subunit n=2 Tax=Tenacibaculum finnmarkense TaxID=2781243 RepID=A0AAP1WH34_9FLAO|nr:efflux RND transporter periplasmic adaptor subunit [Tenacibaculum finnmarkense]MBE7653658.1 efflux RND transporter periplasmic adaptor subunit [Tenacibaculum finnmarkense genomovar finnmarkense]MBE7695950.1 efflux RND transporter periplasmic adaptor subunit [Tenacibaculum finnmarkense genomovar finnmarkense]MCD8428163.1 efflux RND transporter periplasmic adaptor subunit [Tenacibaculum finnmarkense genomovar finnmarkense]MCG8731931.1 efflux RND transporter periplasmic adaptor subunit [Tenacib
MKKYINIISLLITIVSIISCNSKKEDHTGHDHASEEKTGTHKKNKGKNKGKNKSEHQVENEEHAENELHLTSAQIASANIKTAEITQRKIRNSIAVTGTIEVPPQSKATIYAPLESFVYKTYLLPGDKVKKGQTVAVLQHPNFIKLQYSYLEAVNNNKVTKADYERKKMLLANEITSKKSFQIAEGMYNSSKSLVASYAAQLKMANLSASSILTNGIQQYVYIKAPISGYVVENNLNKGLFLAANSEMMEIIDTDHMHAELNVFGTDITKIKKGDEFVFKPSGIDTEYQGVIKLISQKVNDKTKTVNVHGHFEDEKNSLKSGMFINAEILLNGEKTFAIPEAAIIEKEGESFIFAAENTVEFIPLKVTLGNSDTGFVAIKTIEGNNFDVKIVTQGAHFLKGKLLQQAGGMEGHVH